MTGFDHTDKHDIGVLCCCEGGERGKAGRRGNEERGGEVGEKKGVGVKRNRGMEG